MNKNKPFNIFLADDDEDDTFLFQEALEQIPVTASLIIAENGLELMNKLLDTHERPDVIFLDMNMPVKNGLECLAEIRARDHYKDIPVVILSTSVADYLLESAYERGASLYVQKPTSFNNLIIILENCLLKKTNLLPAPSREQFLIRNSTSN